MPGGWMLVNDDYGCGYSDNTDSEQVDATYQAGGTTYTNSKVATAQLPYASLSQAANVVGISDASTYAQGNFDGSGNSFNGEALATAGYSPGAKVTVQGAEFTWPAGAPGTSNLVKNQPAPILASGTGSHLALLGAAPVWMPRATSLPSTPTGRNRKPRYSFRTGAARIRPPVEPSRPVVDSASSRPPSPRSHCLRHRRVSRGSATWSGSTRPTDGGR